MAQSRTGVYAAVAALGLGGYYLYRAGGDPKGATQEVKRKFPAVVCAVSMIHS